MRIDLHGRLIEVTRSGNAWKVFHLGNEGKKRLADDVIIPAEVAESEIVTYLADLYHEHASSKHPEALIVG